MTSPIPPASATTPPPWHRLTPEDVLARLAATADGLTTAEAATRLTAQGPNTLQQRRKAHPIRILARQFQSIIVWVLIGAGVLSGFLGEWTDATAILVIVALNAVVGAWQEFKAERSIEALQELNAPQARVQRNGKVTSIPATDVVTGDLLLLEPGDLVAADARLLQATSLGCVEAALTGEAEAAHKHAETLDADDIPLADRDNLVFLGTSVASGTGTAVVVATAMQTELGRIAQLLAETNEEKSTPLQQHLDSFGRILIFATVGIVALTFALGLWRGTPFLELLVSSVSLAVAAVPEGLPAVVTVALSIGVLRMSRRHALVRRLSAIETLGCTGVICTDKTGTLTLGQMTVRTLHVAGHDFEVTGEGYSPAGEIRIAGRPPDPAQHVHLLELGKALVGGSLARLEPIGATCKLVGDPTEGALFAAGLKAGVTLEQLDRELPQSLTLPFDSDRKRSSILRLQPDGQLRIFCNGAPGTVLSSCNRIAAHDGVRPLTEADRATILAQAGSLADQALRVLASAQSVIAHRPPAELTPDTVEKDLIYLGLAGMYDPPRPEAREAIEKCRSAGIRVIMITGDHPKTALAIARELGIDAAPSPVTGADLDRLSEPELRQKSATAAVYARVTAEHKLRIVRALRADGAVVAMTGDGVNDAPALQGADIGIALGRTGTEVTKQAADMVITDDNFATIVAAVEEGRGTYDNIRKTLQYLLAGNTGELLLVTGCILSGMAMPLLPIHLLWINLLTDGLPAMCLVTDPVDPGVMQRQPRPRSSRIANHPFLRMMFLTGFLTAGVAFATYAWVLRTGTLDDARAAAFAVLVYAELLRSFGVRSATLPIWRIPLLTNPSLLIVVLASFALQIFSQHNDTVGRLLKTAPVPFAIGLLYLAIGAIPLVLLEILKVVRKPASTAKP